MVFLIKKQLNDELGFISVCFGSLIHTDDNDDDKPYIQASEAQMVYYVHDEFGKSWCIYTYKASRLVQHR